MNKHLNVLPFIGMEANHRISDTHSNYLIKTKTKFMVKASGDSHYKAKNKCYEKFKFAISYSHHLKKVTENFLNQLREELSLKHSKDCYLYSGLMLVVDGLHITYDALYDSLFINNTKVAKEINQDKELACKIILNYD